MLDVCPVSCPSAARVQSISALPVWAPLIYYSRPYRSSQL